MERVIDLTEPATAGTAALQRCGSCGDPAPLYRLVGSVEALCERCFDVRYRLQ